MSAEPAKAALQDVLGLRLRGEDAGAPATLGQLPAHAASRWPDRPALWFEGRSWTFAELAGEVDRAAAGLLAAGVRTGEKVALWITNRPEFLFAFFAVLRIGAVVVPLNTRWRTKDLQAGLRVCEATTLISEVQSGPVDYQAMVREALEGAGCPGLRRLVFLSSHDVPGALSWDALLAAGRSEAADAIDRLELAIEPRGVGMLVFTSGTTGKPKAVMLSHQGGIGPSLHRAVSLGLSERSALLVYLPLFHMYALNMAVLPALLTGARQVLMNRFDAAEALRLVGEHRGTTLYGLDTHWQDLLAAYAADPSAYEIGSLEWGSFSAGTDTARSVAATVQQTLCRTISTYGLSESWGAITSGPRGCSIEQSCSASGAPINGVELRIVDPLSGRDVAAGEVGEILVRCEANMLGYYRAEQETRAVLDEAGWLRTGDAGLLRGDGHLRFMGRFKDMLRIGGENVDPAEVEALLLECPLVDRVAVVGCPDERLAEVAAAFIVPATGAQAEDIRRAVDALCKGQIASFKIPRRLELLDALPVNATGKVDKKALRERLLSQPTTRR